MKNKAAVCGGLVAAAISLCAVGPLASTFGATSPALVSQNLVLNTHLDKNQVYTKRVLPSGVWYVAEVQGTYSAYRAKAWYHPDLGVKPGSGPAVVCGKPETAPEFNVPGGQTGRVGMDAESVFARPLNTKVCKSGKMPTHTNRFQITNTGVFHHIRPLGPAVTSPSSNHLYTYPILGYGKPVGFYVTDKPHDDNYGALHILIRRATSADCAGHASQFGLPSDAACASLGS